MDERVEDNKRKDGLTMYDGIMWKTWNWSRRKLVIENKEDSVSLNDPL